MASTNSSDVAQALAAETAANPALMAVIDLEDGFIAMGAVFKAYDQLAGDNSPAWLVVAWAEFKRLEAAMDSVSTLVRVRPGAAQ